MDKARIKYKHIHSYHVPWMMSLEFRFEYESSSPQSVRNALLSFTVLENWASEMGLRYKWNGNINQNNITFWCWRFFFALVSRLPLQLVFFLIFQVVMLRNIYSIPPSNCEIMPATNPLKVLTIVSEPYTHICMGLYSMFPLLILRSVEWRTFIERMCPSIVLNYEILFHL